MGNRYVHEVAFGLAFDLGTAMSDGARALELDLTAVQMRTLRAVSHGPLAMGEVASVLKRDPAQVTRLVADLVARDLLVRTRNPADGRSYLLSLSPDGARVFQRIRTLEEEMQGVMLRGISEKDLGTFVAVAERLMENLAEMDGGAVD
ncbi:MAG: MarR family transcriptional regulator [Gemmatimonadota bacterium]